VRAIGLRFFFSSMFLCAALTAAGALAQTPVASPAAPQPESAPAPGTPSDVPQGGPLIAEPPGTDTLPAVPPTAWEKLDLLLDDVKVTDLVVIFFALLIALAIMRVAAGVGGLRKAATRQAEDTRKVVEASEKAADAARRSAEAAELAISTLHETAEHQLRAYVTVRQFIQAPLKDERGFQGWLLQVAWQNSGATPTKEFRYWAMLREFDRAIPEDFEFTPAGLKDFAGGELGSNSSVSSPPLLVSTQLIARLQDGSRKALLLGQADYQDVLGTDAPRATRFCVELMLMGDASGANPTPFSFSYYPKHNTIT